MPKKPPTSHNDSLVEVVVGVSSWKAKEPPTNHDDSLVASVMVGGKGGMVVMAGQVGVMVIVIVCIVYI